MDPVLKSLIHYQELSLQLSRLNARLEEFPRQIHTIDSELEAAAGAMATARAAVSDRQKDRRGHEMELQDLEVKLKKYNGQLMLVKTNDEYRAMQHEIAGVKKKIGEVEEKILLLMEEADSGNHRMKEDEKSLEGKRKEAEARKAVAREEQGAIEQEASHVTAAYQAARASLTADVLEMFDRIAVKRNGVAIARAREERCQECNVRIRPQVFQEIKRNDQLIHCDSCKRLLYYVDETPPSEAPAADAPARDQRLDSAH